MQCAQDWAMAGKRGRPRGSFSRFKNPVARVGWHLISLKAMWRVAYPMQIGLVQPSKLDSPVPASVERVLAQWAIGHEIQLAAEADEPIKPPSVEEVLAWVHNYRTKPQRRA
jgi:hypothetical protein